MGDLDGGTRRGDALGQLLGHRGGEAQAEGVQVGRGKRDPHGHGMPAVASQQVVAGLDRPARKLKRWFRGSNSLVEEVAQL